MGSVSSARSLGPPFCSPQSTPQRAGQPWSEGNSLPAPESKGHSCHFPGVKGLLGPGTCLAEALPVGLVSTWGSGLGITREHETLVLPLPNACHPRASTGPPGEGASAPAPVGRCVEGETILRLLLRMLPEQWRCGGKGGSGGVGGPERSHLDGATPSVGPICREACFAGTDWPDPCGGAWGQGDWPASCARGRSHLCGLETRGLWVYSGP